MDNQLFRSLLFVPSHNEKLMNSAANSDADILLLDIEDSVQPSSNKQVARDIVRKLLNEGLFTNKTLFPRINDRESGHLLKDVLDLTVDGIAGFMYPKAKKGEDIYFFDKLLETVEYEKGIAIGTFKIIALIETASAVMNVEEIACASKRVVAVAFGSEDFITDLEGVHDYEHTSLSTPRAMIAMGARAAGVIPIDTVHIRVHDLEDLEKNLVISKNLGFEGMLSLHPKELPLIHQYFSPSIEEVQNAEEMLRLAQEAKNSGIGVAIKKGKFIGPPMIKNANKVLRKHSLIKLRSSI